MTIEFLRRYKLAILLLGLLALIALRFRQGKYTSDAFRQAQHPARSPGAAVPADSFVESDPGMRQRIEGALQKLSEDQRKTVEGRMKADRALFESLRDLPENQRREKIEEFFDQNPPPLFDPASPGIGRPGGGGVPENGDPVHLPPPEIRRSMDQQMANSQKTMGGS
jgi:hypothetical protein